MPQASRGRRRRRMTPVLGTQDYRPQETRYATLDRRPAQRI